MNIKQSTRLVDIARMTNLSVCTVSLALRNSPLVKPKTKERITQLAERLNYRPSEAARSLVLNKTRMVGIVSHNLASSYYNQIAHDIQNQLKIHGYLGIVITADSREEQASAVNTFSHRKVDGIIATRLPPELIMDLKNENIPLVIYDVAPAVPADYVVPDLNKGGYMLTEHLIKLGYREIGFIGHMGDDRRFNGFKAALHDNLIPFHREWIMPGIDKYRGGYEAMQNLLRLTERPRAVVCFNDVSAIGAMRALADAGLKVPDDMAVVGFDNIEEGAYAAARLTTIDQQSEEMARKAVELFLQKLDRPQEDAPANIVIGVKLVVRESCGWKKTKGPTP